MLGAVYSGLTSHLTPTQQEILTTQVRKLRHRNTEELTGVTQLGRGSGVGAGGELEMVL